MPTVLSIHSHSIHLLPQRAVFLPACGTLLIADLHLGKGDHLRLHGAPIPATVNRSVLCESLSRLQETVQCTQARRLIVLGDVIHAGTGLTQEVVDTARMAFAAISKSGVQTLFIQGNHDRKLGPFAAELKIELVPKLVEGPLAYVHDPADAPRGLFTFCGHLHPTVSLGLGGAGSHLPAFWRSPDMCVLPAFSRFTGGVMPRVEAGDDLYIIADEQIVHRPIRSLATKLSPTIHQIHPVHRLQPNPAT